MVNKRYKDRLFRMIFGYEKYKGNLLSLYNALNGTSYTNPDDLEINTIDEAIWMGMKNDVSCIINCSMALYEHQSTYSPNMPLRGLMYFGKLYNKYVETNNQNIYGEKLVKIPTPQYYVFYNGERNRPERMELKLSAAFQKKTDTRGFEWTATMLNINFGKNQELMNSCQTIREYAILVDKIRTYQKSYGTLEEAVDRAVDECIENGVLAEFLLEQKAEVIDVVLTEYDEEKTMQMFKEQGIEEGIEVGIEVGREQGRREGQIKLIKKICKKIQKNKTLEEICDDLEEEKEYIQPIYETAKKCAPEYDCDKIYEMITNE